MPKGKISFYDDIKGFGFITSDAEGKDVFFHVKELASSGIEGIANHQRVRYETKEDRGRIAATNIRLLAP